MSRLHPRPAATGPISRRACLGLGAAAMVAPLLPRPAGAAVLRYPLDPRPIAPGVWTIYGAQEPITSKNGGAIANVTVFDTSEGAVLVDAGPSHRYGEALGALARSLTGKPVARIYLTHFHADHCLGATAFGNDVVWAGPGLQADLKRFGNDLASGMYRVAGDWMRGTGVPAPARVAEDGLEAVGERRFRLLRLSGHTSEDLCLFEERSGLLLPGDLVFLDRAPTTPDADLPRWRASLAALGEIGHGLLVPGHGPVEAGRRGLDQTLRGLAAVEAQIGAGFARGLDETEMMAEPLPDWTDGIAVARYEYARSVMHLLPRVEVEGLPVLAG